MKSTDTFVNEIKNLKSLTKKMWRKLFINKINTDVIDTVFIIWAILNVLISQQ